MKTKKHLLALYLIFAFATIKAQSVNGINISVSPQQGQMVVVLNGQVICEDTQSCFIAHLLPGSYHIQVFPADDFHRHMTSRRPLYSKRISYDGQGVHTIHITGETGDEKGDYCPSDVHVMNKREFKNYLESMENANFDNNRLERIDLLPQETSFTSEQCRMISLIFNFDSSRTTLLKKLYPRVVDKVSFYKAIDTLDFMSNQNEVKDFVEKYNKHHP